MADEPKVLQNSIIPSMRPAGGPDQRIKTERPTGSGGEFDKPVNIGGNPIVKPPNPSKGGGEKKQDES
jgi:hypothetical protein